MIMFMTISLKIFFKKTENKSNPPSLTINHNRKEQLTAWQNGIRSESFLRMEKNNEEIKQIEKTMMMEENTSVCKKKIKTCNEDKRWLKDMVNLGKLISKAIQSELIEN